MLTTTPPAFSDADAIAVAVKHYGIKSTVQPLVSERDQNFRLSTKSGLRYTLKISNHAEQLEVVDFQNQALLYVANRNASIPLPRVIPTLDGQLHCRVEHSGEEFFVRVLSWLDGSVLHDSTANPDLARRLGRLLAQFDVALQGFDHPGSNPPSLWDMKRAAGLADLMVHIEDSDLKKIIAQTLDKFVSESKPVLDTLRTQVIHNDMNPGNVLMSNKQPEKISGLIDFGDMTRSPLIIDLAVAAAYQLGEGNDPLAGALPMIAGYHAVVPLQNKEKALLIDLIRTRLITSLLIGSYRSILFPENREYLLISHQSAKSFLINLHQLPDDEALARIRAACPCG
ncbi:MAG: phosphotransferase [Xanthomonadales bacterium]|nr:phosphotransferase [Xanthomonadales bacterium]